MNNDASTAAGLRQKMNQTIDGVLDGSVSVDQARAVSGLAAAIIQTAKTEVDAARVYGEINGGMVQPSGFLQLQKTQHPVLSKKRGQA